MEEGVGMTREARIQLLEDVKALVGEHCNCFIFIANVDADEKDDTEETIINHWEGGRAHALGLMVMAETVIKDDILSEELED